MKNQWRLMKPLDKIKALDLLMKTNEFVCVLSKRYGLEQSEMAAQHRVQFKIDKRNNKTFIVDMLLLSNIGIGMNYNNVIRKMTESDMRSVGAIREYLFCSIENVDRCEYLTEQKINMNIIHMNNQYKIYIKHITDNNLLKDFATLKYVKNSFKKLAQNFNADNIPVSDWMEGIINGS